MTSLTTAPSPTPPAPPGGAERVVELSSLTRYVPVDLDPFCNNRAVTTTAETASGAMNVWRNSLPAEQFPAPGSRLTVAGVPFDLPRPGPAGDNVRCAGQVVPLTGRRLDWLYVLAAGERRVEDVVAVHYDDGGVDFEPLRISDFWAAPAAFGEVCAVRTRAMHYPRHVQPGVPASVWMQRVPVTRGGAVVAVRLPRHVALHVFALTAQSCLTPRDPRDPRDTGAPPHPITGPVRP